MQIEFAGMESDSRAWCGKQIYSSTKVKVNCTDTYTDAFCTEACLSTQCVLSRATTATFGVESISAVSRGPNI